MGTTAGSCSYPWMAQALLGLGLALTFSCGLSAPQLAQAKHLTDLPPAAVNERRDIRCFLSDEKIASMTKLDAILGKRKGLDYVVVMYSLDGMEKVSISFMYPIANGHIHPFPVVYVFGDPVNHPESLQVYVDQTGDGVCKSIIFEPKEGLRKDDRKDDK